MNTDLEQLMEKIEYQFNDSSILLNALTHTSYINEKGSKMDSDNERLEFLGDAVLELVSTDYLFNHYSDMSEGEMTKLRASLVCEPALSMDAKAFGLADYIYLGKGEDSTGGRKKDSIVSDAFEAVIGAIYLDGGLNKAKEFIERFVLDDIDNKKYFYDSKTVLQQRVDQLGDAKLDYEIVKSEGPDHDKTFFAVVKLNDEVIGEGVGHTKKRAQMQAALNALNNMNK